MANKTFPLPARIQNRKDFLRAANNGRKFQAVGLLLQAVPNNKGKLRIGFTTTKKLGKAVVRNRVRRRLREVVRLFFTPYAPQGYDYVFIGKTTTADRSFDLLKNDITYVLNQFLKAREEHRTTFKKEARS